MICSKHEFSLLPPDIFIKPFLLIGAYNGPYIPDSVGGEVIFCLLTQACQGIRWYQEQNNKRKKKKKTKNPDGNEKSHSWTKSLVIGFDLIEIGINIVSQRLGLV